MQIRDSAQRQRKKERKQRQQTSSPVSAARASLSLSLSASIWSLQTNQSNQSIQTQRAATAQDDTLIDSNDGIEYDWLESVHASSSTYTHKPMHAHRHTFIH